MSKEDSVNGATTVKYAMIRVKEETSVRFYRYIAKRVHESGRRVTADTAINLLLDVAEKSE